MSKTTHTHAMLLAVQLASIFKHVDDLGHHRESYRTFEPLEEDVITFNYDDATGRKGRSALDIIVRTERNVFRFRQLYNFGLLLELEITFQDSTDQFVPFLPDVLASADDETDILDRMIDFEYGISILTEHVAKQLTRQ